MKKVGFLSQISLRAVYVWLDRNIGTTQLNVGRRGATWIRSRRRQKADHNDDVASIYTRPLRHPDGLQENLKKNEKKLLFAVRNSLELSM